MLTRKKKDSVIQAHKTHDKDSGSAPVQIAILTEEIRELTLHLKKHKHDHSARRGLLKKIGQRKRLLVYYQREDYNGYMELIQKLGIKHRAIIDRFAKEDDAEESEDDTEEQDAKGVDANREESED